MTYCKNKRIMALLGLITLLAGCQSGDVTQVDPCGIVPAIRTVGTLLAAACSARVGQTSRCVNTITSG